MSDPLPSITIFLDTKLCEGGSASSAWEMVWILPNPGRTKEESGLPDYMTYMIVGPAQWRSCENPNKVNPPVPVDVLFSLYMSYMYINIFAGYMYSSQYSFIFVCSKSVDKHVSLLQECNGVRVRLHVAHCLCVQLLLVLAVCCSFFFQDCM